MLFVEKVLRLYGELTGDLHLVEIDRAGAGSIGLCLAGNRDLAKMSVFVVGYQPGSLAANDGRIRIGDELLEVCQSVSAIESFVIVTNMQLFYGNRRRFYNDCVLLCEYLNRIHL